jgi:tetratricopeptide (TPR) repeat protein
VNSFLKSIATDPSYAPAYVGLGEAELNNVTDGWTSSPQEALDRAENYARKAIELDPVTTNAYLLLGNVYIHYADYDRALDEMKRAIDINKSNPDAYSGLGTALLWSGKIPSAINAFETAAQMNPFLNVTDAMTYGIAYFLADRFADAERIFQRSLDKNDKHSYTRAMLAATYHALGKNSDADREVALTKEINPRFNKNSFGSLLKNQDQMNKIRTALEKTGFK